MSPFVCAISAFINRLLLLTVNTACCFVHIKDSIWGRQDVAVVKNHPNKSSNSFRFFTILSSDTPDTCANFTECSALIIR